MLPLPSRPRSVARARRARRASAAAVVVLLGAAALAGPSTAATRKTTKKTTKKVATAAPVQPAAVAGPAASVPTGGVKSAGTPLVGWGRIADTDRPAVGDAVVADAAASSIIIRRAPGVDEGMLRFDAGRSVFGRISLLALGGQDGWIRVLLPVRPNGTVGWVRMEDVTLRRTPVRVVIELATNMMTVESGNQVLVAARVAAGTNGTPTPVGQYFVKEIVPQANPRGALGPVALGLSAYSEVLMSFAGGSGVVAIHGTNAPGRIGGNVSHGCVRVDNATIARMAGGLVPIGTPVEIVRRRAELPMVRQASTWVERVHLPVAGSPIPAGVTPAAPTPAAPSPAAPAPVAPAPASIPPASVVTAPPA